MNAPNPSCVLRRFKDLPLGAFFYDQIESALNVTVLRIKAGPMVAQAKSGERKRYLGKSRVWHLLSSDRAKHEMTEFLR